MKHPFAFLKRSFSDLKAPCHSLYMSPERVTASHTFEDRGSDMTQMHPYLASQLAIEQHATCSRIRSNSAPPASSLLCTGRRGKRREPSGPSSACAVPCAQRPGSAPNSGTDIATSEQERTMPTHSAAHRIWDRLFAADDARARGYGWQITAQRGGLGRSYRDPRFDLLATCTECRGTGVDADDRPCWVCPGTGRRALDRHFSSAAR